MPTEPQTIRTRLQAPIVVIFTRIVLPALAMMAMAFLLWTQPATQSTALLTPHWLSTLMRYLPICFCSILIGAGIYSLCSQQKPLLLAFITSLSSLIAFLSFLFSEVLTRSMNANLLWNIPFYLMGCVAFCLLLPFSVTLLQLSAAPIRKHFSALADFATTCGCIIALLIIGPLTAMLLDALNLYHDAIWITGFVSFCVLLLAGVFHLLWILGCVLTRKAALNPRIKFNLLLLATIALPIAGLLLNRRLPFPADLQSPWSYLLTFLTALSLLLPDGDGVKGRVLAFFRWATLPFTLYFFILFLPFSPLAIPAMLCIGAGFLLLAPTILLSIHLPALYRSAKCFATRWARWGIALLGFAVIPTIILTSIERDRALVRPLIAAIATPDTTAAVDKLPISEAAAKRIALHLLSQNASERAFPLISHWADYRLFDGLYPRADVLDSLAKRLNLNYTARKSRRTRHHIDSATAPVTTELRGIGTCKLTLAVSIPILRADEFTAPIHLAEGVWVTGLRLKMPNNGPWRDGLLCDRRAATWVYERLTERRIDPALLTLDTLTQGTLRVSPVFEKREIEIDLLLPTPTWCQTPITIGEQAVLLPGGEANPDAISTAATVCFVGPGATHPLPEADLYVMATPGITVSETAPTELPAQGKVDVKRAFLFARGNAYAKNLHLTQALYVGEGWEDALFTPMTPKRSLPKLAPDEPWQQGAIAAQLAEALLYAPHPEYDEPLREAMQKSGALTPNYAYIVVENEAQERALRTLDAIAKQAAAGMDFNAPETVKQSTPSFLCLLLLFCIAILFRNQRKSVPTRGES